MSEFAPISLLFILLCFFQTAFIFILHPKIWPLLSSYCKASPLPISHTQKVYFLLSTHLFLFFVQWNEDGYSQRIQVISQLCTFLFLFCENSLERRRFLVFVFLLSNVSSLYLKLGGIHWVFFAFLFCSYYILLTRKRVPINFTFTLVWVLYLGHSELTAWGLILLHQLLCYYLISLFFIDAKRSAKMTLLYLAILVIISVILSYFSIGVDWNSKLIASGSGAAILFLTIPRNKKSFLIVLTLYSFLTIFLGYLVAPISIHWYYYVFLFLWAVLGLYVFGFLQRPQLLPFFFSALFFFLNNCPEGGWLTDWIKGMDFLLFLLGIARILAPDMGEKK